MADIEPVTTTESASQTIIKKWEAKFTTPNVAYAAAIIVLAAVHFWHPEFFGKAEVFVFLALAALGIQVSPFFRKVEQVVVTGDVTQLMAAKKKPSVPPMAVIALASVVCFVALACGTSPPPNPTTVVQTGFQCGVDIFTLVTTGAEDPVQVAKDCGLTLVQLIAYIDQLLAPNDAGAFAVPTDKLFKLKMVRDHAVERLAAQSPGK